MDDNASSPSIQQTMCKTTSASSHTASSCLPSTKNAPSPDPANVSLQARYYAKLYYYLTMHHHNMDI